MTFLWIVPEARPDGRASPSASVDIGFSGTFESDTHATGVITFRFDAVEIPGGTNPGGETTGGTGTGGSESCCPEFGDVNPCTLTHSLDAVSG